jgi:hypothetical protein
MKRLLHLNSRGAQSQQKLFAFHLILFERDDRVIREINYSSSKVINQKAAKPNRCLSSDGRWSNIASNGIRPL